MSLDPIVERDFIAATENAAIAAAQTMGFGDRRRSDQVAVEAMRGTLNGIEIAGRVVIGEGERDQAPMLYVGERGRDPVGRTRAAAASTSRSIRWRAPISAPPALRAR